MARQTDSQKFMGDATSVEFAARLADRSDSFAHVEEGSRDKTGPARLRLLWENRSFLMRITMYGLIAATAIAFLIPKRYTSVTKLMPPPASSPGMSMVDLLSGKSQGSMGSSIASLGTSIGSNLLGMKSQSDLVAGVLESRTVQDDLISKFDLRKVYRCRYWEDARKALKNHTEVAIDRKSEIITIKVTDGKPERAAAMAQEYVAELNRVLNQISTSSAHRERIFLEGRLNEVKQELENVEQRFSQFASKNTAIDIPEQGKAMVEAAAVLQGQLIAAQSELEGLEQIYTSSNVRVRSLRARVNELRAQLDKLGGKSDSDSSADGDALYPSIRQLPLLGVPYADLYRATKIEEVVFATLTQQYELAKVAEAKEMPVATILDSPDLPEKKSFPPRLLIMLVGMIFAFCGAVTYLMGMAKWQGASEDDPRKVLAREMLATAKARLPWLGSNASLSSGTTERSFWQSIRGHSQPD